MFNNIIGQIQTVTTLNKEIGTGTLPQSLLFYGPKYSGKLSTALEAARVLCCEYGTAEWSCNCPSCNLNRNLLHSDVLMIGPRYFGNEISASGDAFLRTGKLGTRYLFIRAVRKLTRRFDPVIWDGINKLNTIGNEIREIEDKLDIIRPGTELPSPDVLQENIESITELSLSLEKAVATNNIAIRQIRNISLWAHMTSTGKNKIIILENAEIMQVSSSNSLLKLLEEPPQGTYIILLTRRRNSLIPTILSRVRQYPFFIRSKTEVSSVLKKIFNELSGSYENLQEYFNSWQDITPIALKKAAEKFMESVLKGDEFQNPLSEIDRKVDIFSSKENTGEFISALLDVLHSLLKNRFLQTENDSVLSDVFSVEKINKLKNIIYDSYQNSITLNIKPSLILNSLFYNMREAVRE